MDALNIEPEKIFHKLTEAGNEWALAKESADIAESHRHTILSQIKLRYVQADPSLSSTMADTKALADKEYEKYIESMCRLRGEANRAKVKYDAAKDWFEALRTKAATLRAEIGMR